MSTPISRRRFLALAGAAAAGAAGASCRAAVETTATQQGTTATPPPATAAPPPTATSSPPPPTASPRATPTPTAPAPTATPPPLPDLGTQIGQMLMVGFRGLEVGEGEPIVEDICARGLGGVVLFDYDVPTGQPVRNIASPEQVQALAGALQAAAAIPLLIAVDHEGGKITRLSEAHGFPATRSHSDLGAAGDVEATYEQAAQMAETLAECGINLNLAPVVDLCANPDNPIIARYERCFAADADAVADHAAAFVRAHHARGIRCALKHFPGHGSSREDSHLGLVDVSATWSEDELAPYRALIAAGLADAVMTAHVFNTHLDPEYPATLSAAAIDGLLRGQLGYDGVVISDDMQMGAIARHYGFGLAVQRAIAAGVDILAFANQMSYEPDVAARAVEIIARLVEEGTIPAARIAASYRRIMVLKAQT